MKPIKTKEFDKKFDKGEDISQHLDPNTIEKPNLKHKRVNVDFPQWMINSLDNQATKLGITRQALIKVWIAEQIEHHAA